MRAMTMFWPGGMLALAVLCHTLGAADAVVHHFARLFPLNASSANVTGNLSLYTSSIGSLLRNDTLYAVLDVWGVDTAQCKVNACAGHVHANTSGGCASPGAHMLNADGVTDAWEGKFLQYSTTRRDGSLVFTVEIAAGNAAVADHPFVVHVDGAAVACGIVDSGAAYIGAAGAYERSPGPRNFEARLTPLAPSTVAGTVSVWLATSGSLSVTIAASSALAAVCKNNTCEAHVHDGADCASPGARHVDVGPANGTMTYVGPALNDPGFSVFTVAVTGVYAELAGRPLVLHGANRSVTRGVACGVLAPAEALLRKYGATLAPIGVPPEWQVSGSVTIFASDVGMYAIIDVLSAELDIACRGGACGAHVHAGYDCGANVQGHLLDDDGQTDAWGARKMQWIGRRRSGVSIFALEIPFGNTAINGKPFIVHNDVGTKVACGLLHAAVSNSFTDSCCPHSGVA